jgi:hypothetical protein
MVYVVFNVPYSPVALSLKRPSPSNHPMKSGSADVFARGEETHRFYPSARPVLAQVPNEERCGFSRFNVPTSNGTGAVKQISRCTASEIEIKTFGKSSPSKANT